MRQGFAKHASLCPEGVRQGFRDACFAPAERRKPMQRLPAQGRRFGVAFFWLLFLAKQKKVGACLRRAFAARQPRATAQGAMPKQIHPHQPINAHSIPQGER